MYHSISVFGVIAECSTVDVDGEKTLRIVASRTDGGRICVLRTAPWLELRCVDAPKVDAARTTTLRGAAERLVATRKQKRASSRKASITASPPSVIGADGPVYFEVASPVVINVPWEGVIRSLHVYGRGAIDFTTAFAVSDDEFCMRAEDVGRIVLHHAPTNGTGFAQLRAHGTSAISCHEGRLRVQSAALTVLGTACVTMPLLVTKECCVEAKDAGRIYDVTLEGDVAMRGDLRDKSSAVFSCAEWSRVTDHTWVGAAATRLKWARAPTS